METKYHNGIREKKMKEERPKTGEVGFQSAVTWTDAIQSRLSIRRIVASAASVPLLMALSACDGSSGSDTASQATPTANDKVEVAAAANAANSTPVPLALSLKMNTSSITADSQTDRFIIKYKTGTAERGSTSAVQSKLDKLASTFPAKAHHLRRLGIGADVVNTARKLGVMEAKAFMRAIATDPNVEYIEPDVAMQGAMVPSDPEYINQWAYSPSTRTSNLALYGIKAEGAWDISNGSGVTIAMVDNGVSSHSDLDANILAGTDLAIGNRGTGDGRNPGLEGYTCGVTWHGTHVAGILAAVSNNKQGVAGTAPGAKIVPVRVLNGCGNGMMSDVADGITWAAGGSVPGVPPNNFPAKVINVSIYGKGYCSTTYQNAIDYATRRGAAVVVAAGNASADVASFQPASCRNAIVVSNSEFSGQRSDSSNFGQSVDIAAPGENIWSTYNLGTAAPGEESYGFLTGTSMSAPFVSGVIALAQAVAPTPLTLAEVRTLLMQNARPFAGKPDQPIGAGILDATATVAAAKSGKIPVAADFTCSEAPNLMQVTCTDLSTSRGGAPIKSWAWDFDDGIPGLAFTESLNPHWNYDYAGVYQVRLKVTDTNGASSTFTRPLSVLPPSINNLSVNVPVVVPAKNGDMLYYELDVPAGVKGMTVTLRPSQTSETGWLYTRLGTPSAMHPDCQSPFQKGTPGTCIIANPAAGSYYFIIGAQSKLSSTLTATYTQ
ncbi:S8 family serine peptidase [Paraburkholderia dipogonis]|uniref:S8 family serine peptidase n=1 Tax=Paraburkholderia dipogonis TaxID=1211383 RepID=UPI0038BCD96E